MDAHIFQVMIQSVYEGIYRRRIDDTSKKIFMYNTNAEHILSHTTIVVVELS